MFEVQLFGATHGRMSARQRLTRARRKPGLELLERRELLDTGLGSIGKLANAASPQMITRLYYDLLHRAPEASEVAIWTAARSLEDAAREFLSSQEYRTNVITDNYTTVLHREPTSGEASTWLQPMRAGLNEERLTSKFLSSNEYYDQHGGTAESWLTGLYQDLFNRRPDAAGFFLWNRDLQNGMSRETVAFGFVTSREASTRFVDASYQQLLGRNAEPAGETAWVSALGSGLTRSDLTAKIVGSAEYLQTHSSVPVGQAKPASGAVPLHFEFASARSLVAQGYIGVPLVAYSQAQGYGWESLSGLGFRDRNTSEPLTSSFQYGQDGTFRVDLANGNYAVAATLGDAQASHRDMAIWAQGKQVASGLTTAAGQFIRPVFNAQVSNGEIELRIATTGGTGTSFAIDSLDISLISPLGANAGTPPILIQTQPNGAGANASASVTDTQSNASAATFVQQATSSDAASSLNTPLSGASSLNRPAVNAGPSVLANEGTAVLFSGTEKKGVAPFTFLWSFGDGSTAAGTLTPTHVYRNHGVFTVTLTVVDSLGNRSQDTTQATVNDVPPTVTINGAPATGLVGTAIALTSSIFSPSPDDMAAGFHYAWAVTKDGSPFASATTPNLNFTPVDHGTYVVTLTTTDKDSATATSSSTITINDVPFVVSINGASTSSQEGIPIALTSSVTTPSSTSVIADLGYLWSVTKDGSPFASATTPNFNFTPVDHGTYVVTLVATSNSKPLGSSSSTITVTDVSPTVSIGGAPNSSPEGIPIALSSNVSSPSPSDMATGFSYAWSVTKDGNPFSSATSPNLTFTPSEHGSYLITLAATDKDHATAMTTTTITVTDVAPTVSIGGAPTTSPEGVPVALTSTVTVPSSADLAAGFHYAWSVTKDGSPFASATTPNFNFTPVDHGTYVLTLAVTDKDNALATTAKSFTVTDVLPMVNIGGAPTSSQAGTAITLTSNVSSPSPADLATGFHYAWSVTKNGTAFASATTSNFTFTPDGDATYLVTLSATDKDGAVGTDSKSITVSSAAAISFSTDEQTVSVGYQGKQWVFNRPVVSPWAYQAAGNVYWVATNGDDHNTGTALAPFKSINQAVSLAGPGDIVYVHAGIYVENLTITKSGQPGKPIIISCAPGELGKVTITPSAAQVAANPGWPVIIVNGANYVWINGFIIRGPKGQPYAPPTGFSGESDGIGWAGGGGYGDRATNNVIYGNMHCGLKELGHGGTNILMQANVVFDNGTTQYDHGIYCPASDCTIDGNIVFNNASYGIHAYSNPQRLQISRNIVFGNPNGGLVLAGSGSHVYNNVFAYNGTTGIIYYAGTCTNNTVENNIFAFNMTDGTFGDGGPTLGAPSGNVDDYNDYLKIPQSGINPGPHDIYAAPQFINAALGDFRLAIGSPCIASGTNVGLSSQGTTPNLGAF